MHNNSIISQRLATLKRQIQNNDEAIDFASEIADYINQCGRGDDNPELYEDVNMSIYKLIFEGELDIPSSPRDLYLYKRFIVNNGALRLADEI